MHSAFNYVLWIVCGIGIVVAAFALASSGKVWEEVGKRGLLMEHDRSGTASGGAAQPATLSVAAAAERDAEIRQMLQARNARRARRGEPPLDIEAELKRLTAPAVDDSLRAEIRQLVVARNHRRARRGQPPLDVEAEVEREIAELTSLG